MPKRKSAPKLPTGRRLGKATGTARAVSRKTVTVWASLPSVGPCTDSEKNIYIGEAMDWDVVDRYAVLLHECCHVLFPAKYPDGNMRGLTNLIDDCRIERQFVESRPQYADALTVLSTNVIADGKYDEEQKDRWSTEEFDPSLWALLWFRTYLGQKVRRAALKSVVAYAKDRGYWSDDAWRTKFRELCSSGLHLTRLKKVKTKTFEEWCSLYFEVFPEANRQPSDNMPGIPSDGNTQGSSPKKDQEGDGSESDDEADADEAENGGVIVVIKDEDGESGSSGSGEADDEQASSKSGSEEHGHEDAEEFDGEIDDLESSLDALREEVGKVGTDAERAAQDSMDDDNGDPVDSDGDQGDNGSEGDIDDDAPSAKGIGVGDPYIRSSGSHHAIDKSFMISMKRTIRKLRTIAMDTKVCHRRAGRLHMPTVIRAERKGMVARKPFKKKSQLHEDIPVAVAVATDFSISTKNINSKLNNFTHNALFALQQANCECAGVTWNSGAQITKTIDQRISGVQFNHSTSDGGTNLMAATEGSISALKRAKAMRKVAFIFTDGEVWSEQVPLISEEFKRNGFEGVLLVSLEAKVPRAGIVDTAVCHSITSLAKIFEDWTRAQVVRAEGLTPV